MSTEPKKKFDPATATAADIAAQIEQLKKDLIEKQRAEFSGLIDNLKTALTALPEYNPDLVTDKVKAGLLILTANRLGIGLEAAARPEKPKGGNSKRAGDSEKALIETIHEKDKKAKFADVYAKYRTEKTPEMVDLKDNQIRKILIDLGKETKPRG